MTSQTTLTYDISLEEKVHIQERNQLRQTDKVSRLGWKVSRLIVDSGRLTVKYSRLKLGSRELVWFQGKVSRLG